MKCRIDKRGKQVFTPQNERSKLFDKLHNITGDFQKALDVFGITETSGFKEFKNRLRPIDKLNSTDPVLFQGVLERLQMKGLSDNMFKLNTQQLIQKLADFGVSVEVRNQIQAWHGSPHLFQKFSTKFMGSGEGLQAFGWGLYFTDLESIARGYAAMNSTKVNSDVENYLRTTGDYVHLAGLTNSTVSIEYAMDERRGSLEQNLDDYGLSVKEYIGIMQRQLEDRKKFYDSVDPSDSFNTILKQEFEKNLENVETVLKKIRDMVGSENLYSVTLHKGKQPSEYNWLEWDKRLSDKQRDLIIKQAQLEGLPLEEHTYPSGSKGIILKDKKGHIKAIATNGKQIYEWLHQSVGGNILQSDKEVSLFLLRAGIGGVRYPAESASRGATSDNARGFNYVVFDENAVTIEETIQFQKEGVTLIPNGFVITEDGKRNIYLNSDNLNLDTLLHENGHLFLDTLKQRFPEHYQAGLELLTKNSVEAQPYIDYVNATQPNLIPHSEAWKEEVLAQIIGNKGEQLIKSRKKNTIKQWLEDLWSFIGEQFGLTSYTPSEIAEMTLGEFAEAVNVEMLNGEELNLDTNKAFNEGVEAVAKLANEYKKEFGIDSVQHNKVDKLFPAVSKMISEAYEQAETGMTTEEVKEAYKALEEETLQQYKFIVDKGLKVSRWTGEGEPYPNSKSMLKDVRENNHLYFLPNSEAFGKEGDEVDGRAGLKMTDVYLEDGYRMTLSEVFRVVHDYFGHGILGNQFGAVGEENATLQHLDLYSFKALPAVIFQTRGQNSWVNFSGVNDEALRKIREGSKTNNKNLLKEGQEEFKFATPKDNILPKIFNFKTYETARRINEQEEIRKSEAYLDPRGKHEDTNISESLSRLTSKNSGKLNGFSRRSLGVSKRLGDYDVDVIAEYEGNKEVERLIKNVFPQFKGTQKIYEISNGEVYREMMIEALKTNKFKSSVTVHSAEDFSNMRLFVTEDGSTGITITKDGFLGGAFGNPKADRPNNLAQMMLLGIKEGAITAEAFDTVLPDYYSKFGFKAVSRTAFNEEYRPLKENGALEDWDYDTYSKFNNGRPDVVFFIYDGGDRGSIQNRIGQFDYYSTYQIHFTEYYDKDSYDDAYRFMEVEAINKNNYQNQEVNFQISSTEQELQQIKAQAIANGTFMKAPNGKDTNLNERQWLQVRSKAFTDWFGDWQNDPQNASKVVDENGEPLVVYHGTSFRETDTGLKTLSKDGSIFTEFKRDRLSNDGFYFAKDRSVAELYASITSSNVPIYEVFLNIKDWEVFDAKGETFNNLYFRGNPIQKLLDDMMEKGGDVGVKVENIIDSPDGKSVAPQTDVYVANNPNQIKSATDNVGTFDSANSDIRFQIIGEIGAEALDKIEDVTTRINNLKVAKQMVEGGKAPLEIRLTTGWELGVDGKWKYEVDDFKIKNVNIILDKNHEYFDTKVGIYELKDLVDVNNEVFKAYPEIKNQQIVFARGFSENTNMIYSNGTIFISYEKFNENGRFKDREGTLLHEVQHHLQDVEGFARGGSDQQYKPQVIEYFRQLKGGVRSGIFKNGSESKLVRIIEEEFNKRVDSVDRELVIAFQDPIAINSISFGVYKRLAGEVEARNVQERLKLSPQQRKQRLLSETVDVREEDQLVIFDTFEQVNSIDYQNFQNNNLRSHMFIENNSKLGSIRTKPTQRGEKVDSAIVYEAYRGQGVGTELYLETVRNLMIEGKILESDNSQTAPAKRIWEKLVEWGLAIKTGESNFESVPAPSWMTAETTIDEVISNQPIDRSEPSLQELMTYINFQGNTNVTKTEVIELMQANEILDSHELLERLSRAEEQGIFIFTLERLKQTGLFENYEAHKILESKERQGKIKDTLKWLRQNDNFEIQPTQLEKGGSLLSTGKIERQAEESEVTVQDLEGNQIKSNVRLSETITFDYNETLSNNIAFLNQIVRETTWDNLSSQVKDILNSIEVSALDNGIDLRGLPEKYHSATREDILGFLNSLESTLEGNVSPQEFEANRNEFLNFDSITENKEVSRTEVVLGDRLDADVALRDYNLLKVAPDVYKRVPSITYTELLQAEANRRGVETEVLNREVNENFDRSLEDVEQAKLIYLLNSNLNTQETKIQPNLSKLDTFQGNFDYIVEQFPKDFGKWVIETNNSYFKLDWRGITLTNPNQSELAFESVPDYFKEDLLEYSKLSKYLNFNREFDLVYDLDSLQVERDRVINNAQALEEYKGDYVTLKNGEGIMIRNGQGQFIKLNGLVFEQVDEHNNLVFYKPLPKLNEDSLMEIEIPKPVLESNVFDYTLYQTQAKEIENLNRETNRTDYEC